MSISHFHCNVKFSVYERYWSLQKVQMVPTSVLQILSAPTHNDNIDLHSNTYQNNVSFESRSWLRMACNWYRNDKPRGSLLIQITKPSSALKTPVLLSVNIYMLPASERLITLSWFPKPKLHQTISFSQIFTHNVPYYIFNCRNFRVKFHESNKYNHIDQICSTAQFIIIVLFLCLGIEPIFTFIILKNLQYVIGVWYFQWNDTVMDEVHSLYL